MADRFDEILEQLRRDRVEQRRERKEMGARHDRMQEQIDDNLKFLREVNRRAEIVLQDFLRSQEKMRAEIRENTELTRAHTQAVYAVIDRIQGGGGPAPAT